MSARIFTSIVVGCVLLLSIVDADNAFSKEYSSAKEAFGIGAVFHRSQNYKASREPFEVAMKLAKDDAFRVKVYQALLPAYRGIPEFAPLPRSR